MSDRGEERRRFIAESAREFIARQFHDRTGMMPETIPEAVRLAGQLADELEKQDCAPWSRTIDVNSLVESYPALPLADKDTCGHQMNRFGEKCAREKGHKGLHKTNDDLHQQEG